MSVWCWEALWLAATWMDTCDLYLPTLLCISDELAPRQIQSISCNVRNRKENFETVVRRDTGVHPCSCKSQSLPAPDTHLTNGQVFAWLPEHLHYKILSNNAFKRKNDFQFQHVHWFRLVLHYYKKNQPKTPELIDFFVNLEFCDSQNFVSTINFFLDRKTNFL